MRRLLRPILLEFCRTHLILTAATALLTVLFLTVCTLLGLTDATAEGLFLPIRTAADGRGGIENEITKTPPRHGNGGAAHISRKSRIR